MERVAEQEEVRVPAEATIRIPRIRGKRAFAQEPAKGKAGVLAVAGLRDRAAVLAREKETPITIDYPVNKRRQYHARIRQKRSHGVRPNDGREERSVWHRSVAL